MSWTVILSLLSMVYTAVSPELKAAALAELKVLEVSEAGKPFIEWAIKEAEVFLAATTPAVA